MDPLQYFNPLESTCLANENQTHIYIMQIPIGSYMVDTPVNVNGRSLQYFFPLESTCLANENQT